MLPSAARMRRRSEFSAAVRGGRRAGQPALIAHLRRTPIGDAAQRGQHDRGTTPRVGFVVSRAVGSAVVRNRVRRRLRALMWTRLGLLPDGALLVVRAQPAAAVRSSAELAVQLDRVLHRVINEREERCATGSGRRR